MRKTVGTANYHVLKCDQPSLLRLHVTLIRAVILSRDIFQLVFEANQSLVERTFLNGRSQLGALMSDHTISSTTI